MKRKSKVLISSVAAAAVTISGIVGAIPQVQNLSSAIVAYAEESQSVRYYNFSVTGGTLSNGKTTGRAKESQYITVTADEAREGKKFSHWTRNGVTASTEADYSFRMFLQS